MQWEFVAALVLAIPIIAFPVLLWYLDIGSSYAAIREVLKRRATAEERNEVEQYIASTVAKEQRVEKSLSEPKVNHQ